MTDVKTIFQKLLTHTKTLGITDKQLSAQTGINQSALSQIRHGHRGTSLANFLEICTAAGIRPEDAITGHPEGTPPQTINLGSATLTLHHNPPRITITEE